MHLFKKYFIIIGVLLININTTYLSAEEVCFSEQEAVDIITLLDASERDIELLGTCRKLVGELHGELLIRDEKINTLTNDFIKANKRVIEYKDKYDKVKRIAWYSTTASVFLAVIQILSVL